MMDRRKVGVFLVLVIFATTTIAQLPQINKVTESHTYVLRGEDHAMYCRAEWQGGYTTKWFKDGKTIDPNTNPLYEQLKDTQDLILVDPQPGAVEGRYTCNVTNDAGTTPLGYDLTIIIKYLEDKFEYKPHPTHFYEFERYNGFWANCIPPESQPPIRAIWINGTSGKPVNESDPRITIEYVADKKGFFSQIRIDPADKGDEGLWHCKAVHELGTRSVSFRVDLYGPPMGAKNMRVKQYVTDGFIMEWDYLRNDLAYYDIEITRTSTAVTKKIRMPENKYPQWWQTLTYQFRGLVLDENYEIRMRAMSILNQTGLWSEVFKTQTTSRFIPFFLNQLPKTIKMGEGKKTELKCDVEGNPLPVFEWYRNSVLIDPTEPGITYDGNKLVISSPHRNDTGTLYHCKAVNDVGGLAGDKGKVKVEWINPGYRRKPGSTYIYKTTTFKRISFLSPIGDPMPEITLFVKKRRVNPRNYPGHKTVLYKDPMGVVTNTVDISNPGGAQSVGTYTVMSSNLAGAYNTTFKLVLAEAPQKISYFKVFRQISGAVTFELEPPKSLENMAAIGVKYRHDLKKFEVKMREAGHSSQVTQVDAEFKDDNYFRRLLTVRNLKINVRYTFNVRCYDNGNQASVWSSSLRHTIPANLPPSIINGPKSDYTVEEKTTFHLPCVSSSMAPVTVKWFKANTTIAPTDSRFTVTSVGNLTFVGLSHNLHEGEYYCRVTNKYGSATSGTGKVTVLYLSEKFIYHRRSISFAADTKEIRVLCLPPASNPPAKVLWSNGTEVFLKYSLTVIEDNYYQKDGQRYFSVKIINPEQYEGSEIGCAAYNPTFGFNGRYKLALTKIVKAEKPSVTDIAYKVTTPSALQVTWKTNVAYGTTKVDVIKDGGIVVSVVANITTSRKQSIEIGGLEKRLYQLRVQVTNTDTEEKSDRVEVLMQGVLPSLVKGLEPTVTFREGSTKETLHCVFMGVPWVEARWSKDGVQISSNGSRYEISADTRTLRILNVSLDQRGKYKCEGWNGELSSTTAPASSLSLVQVMYIRSEFRLAGKNKEFVDAEGKRDVTFSCQPPLSFPPFSQVIWKRNGVILEGSRFTTSNKNGVDSLTFEAVPSDVGNYTCQYGHALGTRGHIMKLSVAVEPVVKKISFELLSPSQIKIEWSVNIAEAQSTLTIINTKGDTVDTVSTSGFTHTMQNADANTLYKFRVQLRSKQGLLSKLKEVQMNGIVPSIASSLPAVNNVKENDDVRLTCDFTGVPWVNVQWWKDGKRITSADNGYELTRENRELLITHVRAPQHAGVYKCVGENRMGSDHSTANINVLYLRDKFEFADTSKTFMNIPGQRNITFKCKPPLAHPAFGAMTWLYNGTAITDRRYKQSEVESTNILQFEAHPELQGAYTCIYIHPLGWRAHNMSLVWKRMEPPNVSNLQYIVKSASTIRVKWYGNYPDATYHLSMAGEVGGVRRATIEGDHFYTMRNTSNLVLYLFSLYATRPDGTPGVTTKLQMQGYKPRVRNNLPSVHKPEPWEQRDGVSMYCGFDGEPWPHISWYKNNEKIQQGILGYSWNENNQTLQINNVSRKHQGVYKCVGENILGTTETDGSLLNVVYLDDVFQYGDANKSFYDADGYRAISFSCHSPLAYPQFESVVWRRGSEVLTKGSKYTTSHSPTGMDTLSFEAVATDAGIYTCSYKHPMGVQQHSVQLTMANGKPTVSQLEYELLSTTEIRISYRVDFEHTRNTLTVKKALTDTVIRTVHNVTQSFTFVFDAPALFTFLVVAIGVNDAVSDLVAVKMIGKAPEYSLQNIPTNHRLREAHKLKLNCKFDGVPYVLVSWTKDGIEIADGIDKYQLTNHNRSLTITKTQTRHAGVFVCHGVNILGEKSGPENTIEIIYFATKFEFAGNDQTFQDADNERSVSFKCQPPAAFPSVGDVTWLRDGIVLTDNNKYKRDTQTRLDVLTFDATMSDLGRYTCRYFNPECQACGARQHSMELKLYDGPVRPQNLKAIDKSWNFVVLQWTIVDVPVDSITVENAGKSTDLPGGSRSYIVKGLRENQQYNFIVKSVKDVKISPPATISVQTLKKPVIGTLKSVENVKVSSITTTSALISWRTPSQLNGNHPLLVKYNIVYCTSTDQCKTGQTGQTEFKLTGLQPLTEYKCTIASINELGVRGGVKEGVFETLSNLVIEAIKELHVIEQGWDRLSVQWKQPDSRQLKVISNLRLKWGEEPGQQIAVDKTQTRHTITSLREGQRYTLVLRVISRIGDGPVATIQAQTLDLGVLGGAANASFTHKEGAENATGVLRWSPPLQLSNTPVHQVRYNVHICQSSNCQDHAVAGKQEVFVKEFGGLKPGFTYTVSLTTIRPDGEVGERVQLQLTMLMETRKIGEPSRVRIVRNVTSLHMTWTTPEYLAGVPGAQLVYKLTFCRITDESARADCRHLKTNETEYFFDKLQKETKYEVLLAAFDPRGGLGKVYDVIAATGDTKLPVTNQPSTKNVETRPSNTFTTSNIPSTPFVRRTFGPPKETVSNPLGAGVIVGIVCAVLLIAAIAVVGAAIYRRHKNL